jgi:hypothetical protein
MKKENRWKGVADEYKIWEGDGPKDKLESWAITKSPQRPEKNQIEEWGEEDALSEWEEAEEDTA